ncbi:MAG TPA: 4Fe-4S binding protein [bacterium]|nr:4Fe-4S binding protein [bacterium]
MAVKESERCVSKKEAPVVAAAFPVLPEDPPLRSAVRRSRMARRRALVLGAVYVLMAAHLGQWLLTGRTVSPVEPSESMRTLELGQVNAGFLFFIFAIVATAIFGRFFCGWGCHIVALQDLCGWLMKRAGVKPRPFRSRALLWAPAALAFYMFAWPTVSRMVLIPALHAVFPQTAEAVTPPASFPGFSNHLMTESFWATFPSAAIAVVFLFVCGFAVVLLLGQKGFCTYGCPYGGIFAPVDKLARGRIRVTEACNGCGHCTAVCTSNVRVHEEVRNFKMVADPGCMKCMDCVSVCPNDALFYGFGSTAGAAVRGAKKRAPRKWDLSLRGEIAVAVVFTLALLSYRGLYDRVPLLMAVGLALCVTYLLWTIARLVSENAVAVQTVSWKRDGRITAKGIAGSAIAGVLILLTIHSAIVKIERASAERIDRRIAVPAEEVFAGNFVPAGSDAAQDVARAAAHYRRADAISAGGWGLLEVSAIGARRAWLALVTGDLQEAESQLRRVLARRPAEIGARDGLARVLLLQGRIDDAIHEWKETIALDPTNAGLHLGLADAYRGAGRTAEEQMERTIAENLALPSTR